MVRTYWLVPVFNEASGNLDLQLSARRPDRCLSAPCYVRVILALLRGGQSAALARKVAAMSS
jgi:hypothetical protein